ncbi:MAG TPA: hypothetical protein VGX28_06915 [Frankiaceae bacterium]|jgi:hypothetical protein|nr:hypothetical protein [Frankiaceae bacterium]
MSPRAASLLVGVAALAVALAAGWVAMLRLTEPVVESTIDSVFPRGDRTLVVRYYAGEKGCVDPAGVEVEETATEVRLTARVRLRRGDRECSTGGRVVQDTVRLRASYRDRAIVDAATGERLGYPDATSRARGEPERALAAS